MLDTGAGAAAHRGGADGRRRARSPTATRSSPARSSTATRSCVGRTHGVHAEPTTFGLRLAGFAFEADRNLERLRRGFEQAAVGKLSGAVGTYASVPPAIERRVMETLGLRAEDVSTQIVPRDRHAELMQAIALAGAGLERFGTEVRNLQRTEVREVEEPFGAGQKGSSAMPHKRNPILSERICGLARVLRGYAQTAVENVALWHERDISHSGAERVVLPDATILLDYMQHVGGAGRRGDDRPSRAHARQPRADPRRAAQPAHPDGAGRGGDAARRRLPAGPGERPASVGRGDDLRELLDARRPDLDLEAAFDHDAYLHHVPEVFERLETLRG